MGVLGPAGFRRRGRRRGLAVGVAAGAAMGRNSAKKNEQPAEASSPEPAASGYAAELQELEKLKQQGIITQEEFDAKKKKILGI